MAAGESTPVTPRSESVKIAWRRIVLYAWMVTTLTLLGRLFVALVGGFRLLRRAQSGGCEKIGRAADLARAKLGIAEDLRIRNSSDVRSPVIWCWRWPPVLLVPDGLDCGVDWVGVICHELAHWRRRDHISGLIAELAVCLLPWNPLLWWSKRRMVRLSEQACDDWVLASGQAGTDYAQSLLNMSPEVQMAFLPTVIGKEKPMKERILRIAKERCGDPRVGAGWALAVSIIAVSLTVGAAFAQRRPAKPEEPGRDARLDREERQRQVSPERRAELDGLAQELRARTAQTSEKLAELERSGKGEGEQAQQVRAELRELHERMAGLERELGGPEPERRQRDGRQRQVEEQPFGDFGRQRQEPGRRERPEIEGRMRELSQNLRELEQAAQGKELALNRLEERGESDTDEAHSIRRELQEVRGRMQAVTEELALLERTGPAVTDARSMHEPLPHVEALMQERENLRQRARDIESELERLGAENPEMSGKLQDELSAVHERIEQVERERERFEHPVPRVETPSQPSAEARRRQLISRREQLQAQMRETELQLRELNEQGNRTGGEPPVPRGQLGEFRDRPQPLGPGPRERAFDAAGRDGPQPPERSDMERRVRELAGQVDRLSEQMREMRDLMSQLLEQGGSRQQR
ncbi:MAG: M56 family metallopeptidase [Planctomycetota bacterium]